MRPSFVSALLFVTGCADATPTWYADVGPIVAARCSSCHGAGADLDLSDPETARGVREWMAHQVRTKQMPPWGVTAGRPVQDDPSLSAEQIDTIVRWADAGGPLGLPGVAPPQPPTKIGDAFEPDTTVRMAEAWSPPEGDSYRCFPLDWPWDEERFVTAQVGEPGDERAVHHLVLFFVHPDEGDVVAEFDAEDDGPGYTCYGGITPAIYEGTTPRFRFAAAWAPGNLGVRMPEGTGLRVPRGTVPVLQVHYHQDGAETLDQSGFSLRTEPTVAQEGWTLPWFDLRWYFDDLGMEIPAGARGVEHSHQGRPGTSPLFLDVSEGTRIEGGLKMWTAMPHMHHLGRTLDVDVVANTGTERVLEAGRYDFRWQREYRFEEPVILEPNDELRVRCTFDNDAETRASRGVEPVEPQTTWFGERTDDEMCLVIAYVTALDPAEGAAARTTR